MDLFFKCHGYTEEVTHVTGPNNLHTDQYSTNIHTWMPQKLKRKACSWEFTGKKGLEKSQGNLTVRKSGKHVFSSVNRIEV